MQTSDPIANGITNGITNDITNDITNGITDAVCFWRSAPDQSAWGEVRRQQGGHDGVSPSPLRVRDGEGKLHGIRDDSGRERFTR